MGMDHTAELRGDVDFKRSGCEVKHSARPADNGSLVVGISDWNTASPLTWHPTRSPSRRPPDT
jgi:hypothetical protein